MQGDSDFYTDFKSVVIRLRRAERRIEQQLKRHESEV